MSNNPEVQKTLKTIQEKQAKIADNIAEAQINKNDVFYKLICHFLPFTHEYTVVNAREKNINEYLPKNVPVLHYSGECEDSAMNFIQNNLRDNLQFITAYKGNLPTNNCEFVYAYSDTYCYTVKLTYHFATKNDLINWKLSFTA